MKHSNRLPNRLTIIWEQEIFQVSRDGKWRIERTGDMTYELIDTGKMRNLQPCVMFAGSLRECKEEAEKSQ